VAEVDVSSRLAAVMAAQTLKARYFRLLDTRRWEEWASLFSEDAVLDAGDDMAVHGFPRVAGIVHGRDRILAGSRRALEGTRSLHVGFMPEVEVIAHDRVRATWGMTDRVEYPDGRVLEGAGHYHDEYTCVDGHWQIAGSRLVRLHLGWQGTTSGPGTPERPDA
jgi:hypothetical protein